MKTFFIRYNHPIRHARQGSRRSIALRCANGRILAILLSLNVFLPSWSLDKSTLKTTAVGSRTCYVYEAKEGETLYGISREFGVTQEEIIELNEKVRTGVKKGMQLRIPVSSTRFERDRTLAAAPAPSKGVTTHLVQAKETVFGITRRYGITSEQLREANPTFDGNLKVGQTLVIPQPADKAAADKGGIGRQCGVTTHPVQAKETIYGIGRQYGVTSEQLKRANPFLNDRMPRVGDTLTIPSKGETASPVYKISETKIESKIDDDAVDVDALRPVEYALSSYRRPEAPVDASPVNVSLLMPFMLDRESEQDQTLSKFIEFYEGVLIGLDELKAAGYVVRLNVYDIEKTADKVESVLRQHPEIGRGDLIIGPAYAGQVGILSRYSIHRQVPLLVPFTRRVSGIGQNTHAFQFNGGTGSEWEFVTNLVVKYLTGKRVLVVNYNSDANDEAAQYAKYLSQKLPLYGIECQTSNYSIYSFPNLVGSLSDNQENVIVLGTREATLAQDALNEIARWREQGKKVTVFGFDNWGAAKLEQVKPVCYYSKFNVNESDATYQEYAAKLRREFGVTTTREPRYDLLGRDLIVYFVKHLAVGSRTWTPSGDMVEEELQSRFSWRRMGSGGYVNQACYFITKP